MGTEISEDRDGKGGWPRALADGLVAAWPICLGYFPAGAAIGVLAQKVGLHPLEIGLMSLMVFAGSGQFIAVSMIGAGATIISIVITTFIVNLRHLLMSSSLSVHLKGTGNGWLLLYGYGITDETFAVNLSRFRDGIWDWRRALVVNLTAASAWIGSNVVGCYGAQFIPPKAFGIDYAMIGMFICLLVLQLRGAIYVAVAILAGILAVAVSMHLPGNAYIVIASVAAATAGVFLKKIPFFVKRDGDGS
jgi:4-azaleucine resistance transporter AzlC